MHRRVRAAHAERCVWRPARHMHALADVIVAHAHPLLLWSAYPIHPAPHLAALPVSRSLCCRSC